MANRFASPREAFVDSAGLPYSGGKLFFYTSGTSAKLNTFSDSALTVANANPIVLDSAGRLPGDVFLQTLQYKVVLSPSTDSDPPTAPIWTADPVYASDYSTAAQFMSGNGSPNGTTAGTQGSATIKASSYWDYTNNILYVCTTTGTTSTAVWTAVNPAGAVTSVPPPQGYLTPTSGTPIIASDVTAATAVYYTPYIGLTVPIYNGTSFISNSIVTELQATLVASHAASNIYDFYVFLLNGVVTLGTGPSWSAGTSGSITAGSCARGTGTGGAALTRLSGIWTNAASMTMRYGNGTLTTTVSANQGTYVGSMFVDGTNGQVTCHRSYGQSRKWGLWNAYNRAPIVLQAGDGTASWSYNTATWRSSNNAAANSLTVFSGLAEEQYITRFNQLGQNQDNNSTSSCEIGIGWNSTSSPSGKTGAHHWSVGLVGAAVTKSDMVAEYMNAPSLGINLISALENGHTSTAANFFGTSASMVLIAAYRA